MGNQDSANSEGVFRLRYAALNMTVFYGGFHKMQNQDGANSGGMSPLSARGGIGRHDRLVRIVIPSAA